MIISERKVFYWKVSSPFSVTRRSHPLQVRKTLPVNFCPRGHPWHFAHNPSGILVTSALGFKAHLRASLSASSDSPLVWHLLISWWPAWKLSIFDPHTCTRTGIGGTLNFSSFCEATLPMLWNLQCVYLDILWCLVARAQWIAQIHFCARLLLANMAGGSLFPLTFSSKNYKLIWKFK